MGTKVTVQQYEGKWDCPNCGSKGHRWSRRFCGSCGKGRTKSVRPYLPAGTPALTDASLIAEAKAGPDWPCRHCTSLNTDLNQYCSQCGASRTTEVTAPQSDDPSPTLAAVAPVATARRRSMPTYAPSLPKVSFQQAVGVPWYYKIGALVGLFLLFWAGWFFLFKTDEVLLQVVDRTWSITVPVEQFKTLRQEGWDPPDDAQILGSTEKVYDTQPVFSHTDEGTRPTKVKVGENEYKCGVEELPSGYFQDKICKEPIYEMQDVPYKDDIYVDVPILKSWYVYEVERWVQTRTLSASGTGSEVQWPTGSLEARERLNSDRATEVYEVHFLDSDSTQYSRVFSKQEWYTLRPGVRVSAYINKVGMIVSIERE